MKKFFCGIYGGICGYILFRLWFLLWGLNLTLDRIWSESSRYYNIGVTILLVLSCFIPAVYSYKNFDEWWWLGVIVAPIQAAAVTVLCVSIVYLIFFKYVALTIAFLVIFAIACLANPAGTIETAAGAIIAVFGSAPLIIPAIIAIIVACILWGISR